MYDGKLAGVKVIVHPPVKTTKQVKRTWKERLFSLSPFTKYKSEECLCEMLEDDQIISDNNGTLIMNQKTYNKLSKELYARK